MTEHTKRAGWFKSGYNEETHLTPAHADAARINGRLGGRPWSAHYKALAALNVGGAHLMPWRMGANGEPLPGQHWAHSLIRRVALRTGRAFAQSGGASGLIVTRIR